jgi:small-conductance mechanosensitive channel
MRLRVWMAGLLVFATFAGAAQVDDRLANLREKIDTLEGVVNSTANAGEKARLGETLQRLRRELEVLDERQAIEARERLLVATKPNGTIDILRDKLRSTDVTTEEAEARIKQIVARRKQIAAEREALNGQIAVLSEKSGAAATAQQVQLKQRLFNKAEELRALALEREAADAQVELGREIERLREEFKDVHAAGEHPSLRAMFEARALLSDRRRTDGRLKQVAANFDRNRVVSQTALDLARQKLEKFAEDLALLEKRTGFFNRDVQIERLVAEERNQQVALTERIPFLVRQVDAIEKTQALLNDRQELAALELTFHAEQLDALESGYVRRLRWPAVALTGIVLMHFLAGYLLLPLLYKNETLVLARRLVRYALVVVATVVVAGFLFDDLKVVAAAGGLVSAALVISLQDACASVFAWFVIMLGGKFGIGDRLEIEGTRGDVIDIDLLRTTLLEVNAWLGTDEPTGRVITMPNNFIFRTKVFNFTHGHPYTWGKIDLTVTNATPIAAAVALFERILQEEVGPLFTLAQSASASMRRRYGVEDAIYKPQVNLQIVDTGVTLSLLYVSHFRESSITRNQLYRRLVTELERHPHIQLSCPTLQLLHDNLVEGAPSAVMGSASAPAPRVAARGVPGSVGLRN